jgi:hypothetical protein
MRSSRPLDTPTLRPWRVTGSLSSAGKTYVNALSSMAGGSSRWPLDLRLSSAEQKDVEYIQELEVLDLTSGVWVAKESMATNREQRGSYRTTACTDAAGNVLLYSNFNVNPRASQRRGRAICTDDSPCLLSL